MRVVPRLSAGVRGGRIVGSRRPSIVLPVLGEPMKSMLWTIRPPTERGRPSTTRRECPPARVVGRQDDPLQRILVRLAAADPPLAEGATPPSELPHVARHP